MRETKGETAVKNKMTYRWLLIISGALTLGICAVMNLYLIPAIESSTEGLRCFDMNFGYSYEKASQFLSLLSEEGRGIYLNWQLPLDFFYPVAYGAFFSLLLARLSGKGAKLIAFPALLAAFDYCEIVCVLRMLKAETLSSSLVAVSSVATIIKTILMYLCILMILILLVRRIAAKRKQRVKAEPDAA